jgi:hypothetical protein
MRCLDGPEAALFRGGVGMMVDQLVLELNASPRRDDETFAADELTSGFGFSAPRWYSMWEPEQRVWLLERVTSALLATRAAPPHAAMFEATIESVYIEIADLIAMEITTGKPIERGSWRGSLLDAYVQRCPGDSLLGALQFEATTLDPCLPPSLVKQWKATEHTSETDLSSDRQSKPDAKNKNADENGASGEPDWMEWWTSVIQRLVDATYGPRLYHAAERYRDDNPKMLRRFLESKGMTDKFIRRIPPLRSRSQTQATIDRLQAIVFEGE